MSSAWPEALTAVSTGAALAVYDTPDDDVDTALAAGVAKAVGAICSATASEARSR